MMIGSVGDDVSQLTYTGGRSPAPSLVPVDLELTGKRVVVTGAGRGIGLAVTRGFVAEGAHVVAGSRTVSAELKELAEEGSVTPVEVDLGAPDGPDRLVEAAGERIDVLVNNVGAAPPRTEGFLAVTDDQWGLTWNLDVMAAVRATRAALPVMLAAGGGAIVNIGSVNARLADPLVVDYSAAKAALVNLAKSLSKEFGGRGVRVNTVAPGPVATDLWLGGGGVAATVGAARGLASEDVAAGAAAAMVTGRFTRPEEVADLVLLLASPRTANVTGADFTIDGGLITTV
jgi:NAD(P)-dependent dehydrogenase (short-subunit alcohol dehydrogenase family)